MAAETALALFGGVTEYFSTPLVSTPVTVVFLGAATCGKNW